MLEQKERSSDLVSPVDLQLKTQVYKTTASFIPECLDLDIAVREKSESRALHSLQQAVTVHLRVASHGDPTGLIPRRAPYPHYVRYYMYRALAILSWPLTPGQAKVRTFTIPSVD